jgi:hypothetical protein
MLVIEVQRYCILKFQDPIFVSIYRVLYSQSLRCFSAVSQLIDQPYFLFPFHEQSLPRIGIKIHLNTHLSMSNIESWLPIRKKSLRWASDYTPGLGPTTSNKQRGTPLSNAYLRFFWAWQSSITLKTPITGADPVS